MVCNACVPIYEAGKVIQCCEDLALCLEVEARVANVSFRCFGRRSVILTMFQDPWLIPDRQFMDCKVVRAFMAWSANFHKGALSPLAIGGPLMRLFTIELMIVHNLPYLSWRICSAWWIPPVAVSRPHTAFWFYHRGIGVDRSSCSHCQCLCKTSHSVGSAVWTRGTYLVLRGTLFSG